jgi:isochorismate pyruvate lyase
MNHRLFVFAALFVANAGFAHAQDVDPATRPAFWGAPSVDGGKCCANIDRLDHDIIRLMAEREKYVAEAGRFKANPGAVSAPARVEEVIAKVKTIARENGLAETVAERTFRAMIGAFEDYEREEWARRNTNPQ